MTSEVVLRLKRFDLPRRGHQPGIDNLLYEDNSLTLRTETSSTSLFQVKKAITPKSGEVGGSRVMASWDNLDDLRNRALVGTSQLHKLLPDGRIVPLDPDDNLVVLGTDRVDQYMEGQYGALYAAAEVRERGGRVLAVGDPGSTEFQQALTPIIHRTPSNPASCPFWGIIPPVTGHRCHNQ